MSSNQDLNKKPSSDEADLSGFDGLWDVGYEETQNFIRLKQSKLQNKQKDEIDLMQKELENKEFELQKFEWQLCEREKELKKLYDELHKLIELNKKLNTQLSDFEELSAKQEQMLLLLGKDPLDNKEPVLPNFN